MFFETFDTDITPVFRFYVDAPFCLPFKIEDGEAIIALGTAILLGRTAWLASGCCKGDSRRGSATTAARCEPTSAPPVSTPRRTVSSRRPTVSK